MTVRQLINKLNALEYAAKSYDPSRNDLMIRTLDGHTYRFNHAGWAWIVTIR